MLKDKEIAKKLKIGAVTLSRWKRNRPELYTRIKESYKCEAVLEKLGVSLDEAKEVIEKYKGRNDEKN